MASGDALNQRPVVPDGFEFGGGQVRGEWGSAIEAKHECGLSDLLRDLASPAGAVYAEEISDELHGTGMAYRTDPRPHTYQTSGFLERHRHVHEATEGR